MSKFKLKAICIIVLVTSTLLAVQQWSVSDNGWFYLRSGFHIPSSARIISSGETHGGFLGDGESHVVFETSHEMLQRWLREPPPWSNDDWQRGPVPAEIGFHCTFGTTNPSTERIGGKLRDDVFDSSNIWYVANNRFVKAERGEPLWYHNGDLMVIDLDNNRVWLSSWDF